MSEMDKMIPCSLLNKEIDCAYCYEIGLAIGNILNPSFLPDDIGDKKTAAEICNKCKYIQW